MSPRLWRCGATNDLRQVYLRPIDRTANPRAGAPWSPLAAEAARGESALFGVVLLLLVPIVAEGDEMTRPHCPRCFAVIGQGLTLFPMEGLHPKYLPNYSPAWCR